MTSKSSASSLPCKSDRVPAKRMAVPISQVKLIIITRLTEAIEITAARIAETIEIVRVTKIITTETKSNVT